MSKKILITGGSGFIGTNVMQYFIEHNFLVLNIDISTPKNEAHFLYWEKVSLLDKQKLKKVMESFAPDYVVHLAARTDLNGTTEKDYESNTNGTENLIVILNQTPSVKKVIFTSSMLVCNLGYIPKNDIDYNPSTIYGQSKVEMEKIIKNTQHKYLYDIVRPTSIWGPWFGTPYKDFFDMVILNTYFNIKNNQVQKTYGFVSNTVQQLVDILFTNTNGQTYYLGDTPTLIINEWANEISQIVRNKKVKTLPMFLVKSLAIFGDVLSLIKLKFPITSFRLKNMTTDNIMNLTNTLEVSEMKYKNTNENILVTLNWIKKYGKK